MHDEVKHVVIGVSILGLNRARPTKNGIIAMPYIPRERWRKNIKTNKVSFYEDGFVLIPMIQIKSKKVDLIRKKLHKIIDDCLNTYTSVNKEKV